MTMFIEGLDPGHRPIVSQYRQEHIKVSFLRLLNYAKAQGVAVRSRDRRPKRVTLQEPSKSTRTKTLHPNWKPSGSTQLIPSISGSEGNSEFLSAEAAATEAYVKGQGENHSHEYGTSTEDPSWTYTQASTEMTRDTDSFDAVLAFCNRLQAYTPAPRLSQEDRTTSHSRPGCVGQPTGKSYNRTSAPQGDPGKKHAFICYHCYEERPHASLMFTPFEGIC